MKSHLNHQNNMPEINENNEASSEKMFSFSINKTSFQHSLPNDKINQFFDQPKQKESPKHHVNLRSTPNRTSINKSSPDNIPFSNLSEENSPKKNTTEQKDLSSSLDNSLTPDSEKKPFFSNQTNNQISKVTYNREKSIEKVKNYLKRENRSNNSNAPKPNIIIKTTKIITGLNFSLANNNKNADIMVTNSKAKNDNSREIQLNYNYEIEDTNVSNIRQQDENKIISHIIDPSQKNEDLHSSKFKPIVKSENIVEIDPALNPKTETPENQKSNSCNKDINKISPPLNLKSEEVAQPIFNSKNNIVKSEFKPNQSDENIYQKVKHENLISSIPNQRDENIYSKVKSENLINSIPNQRIENQKEPIFDNIVKTENTVKIKTEPVFNTTRTEESNINSKVKKENISTPNIISIQKNDKICKELAPNSSRNSENLIRAASNPIPKNIKKIKTSSTSSQQNENISKPSSNSIIQNDTSISSPNTIFLDRQNDLISELETRAQNITKDINDRLQQNRHDSEIQYLRDARRDIWTRIEQTENAIQRYSPNTENEPSISQSSSSSLISFESESSREITRESSSTPSSSISTNDVFPDDQEYANEIDPELLNEMTKINREIFHHNHFRGCQSAAIAAAIQKKDLLVLMPTGGGKSLIYQMAGYIENKLTIVISPLISLIMDQMRSLEKLNLSSSAFLGETGSQEYQDIVRKIESNDTRFVFLTPEKLMQSDIILNFLIEINKKGLIGRFVIDEAHCVSQWGHDFRPSYKNLHVLKQIFGEVPLIALTATATEKVQNDIIIALKMQNCAVFKMSFNRPNLIYEVADKGDTNQTYGTILKFIQDHHFENKSGLIFCMSANDTESLCEFLNNYKLKCRYYHGQMKKIKERHEVQRLWTIGKVKIVIATMAFGMGIDKSDVRFVIHHTIPKSMDAFYQESGRAGRDGKTAYCLILYNVTDVLRVKRAITRDYRSSSNENENDSLMVTDPEVDNDGDVCLEGDENDDDINIDSDGNENEPAESLNSLMKKRRKNNASVLHDLELFKSIENFCNERRTCRRVMMLNYFNEDFDQKECNETCDNCIRREKGAVKFVSPDMTKVACALVSIVDAINHRRPDAPPFPTVRHVINIYMGVNNGTIRVSKDSELPQYAKGVNFKGREYVLYKTFPILVQKEILTEKLKSLAHGTIIIYSTGPNFKKFMELNKPEIVVNYDYSIVPEGMNRAESNNLYQHLIDIRDKIAEERGEFPSTLLNFNSLKKIVFQKPKSIVELTSILPEVPQNMIDLIAEKFINAVIKFEEYLKRIPESSTQLRRSISTPVPCANTNETNNVNAKNSITKKVKPPERSKSTFNANNKNTNFNYLQLESSADKVKEKKLNKKDNDNDNDDNRQRQKQKKGAQANFINKLKNAF